VHGFSGAPGDAKLLCQGAPEVGFDSGKKFSLKDPCKFVLTDRKKKMPDRRQAIVIEIIKGRLERDSKNNFSE